jgi:hypothetical protein
MVLEIGHFRKEIRNTWKGSKCGAGEGCRRSVGPIVYKMKKPYTESRRRGISCTQYKEGMLTGLVTLFVGTAF